ncbi:tyrosine-type recombinase/integrase [Thermodesulfobacteriota bacterium]
MGVFQKNGNWWIDFYHQGKRIRRKVGPSKKVAEMALADVQVKKAKNDFLGVCEPKRIPFKDFAAEYLEYSRANKALSSYERDETVVRAHLVPVWGDYQMSRITSKMIEDYKLKRLESVAPATLNREMNTIKSLFSKAVEWEYLRDSPAKPVKWLKTSRGSMRFLSREEADGFLEASKASQNHHFYPVVTVALYTGMRRGEILRLQWQDVDFKRGKINVVSRDGGHTKNYESRSIPMNGSLRGALKKHPRHLHSPYVFCNAKGEPFKDVDTSFANALKKSGVPHFRFHDLRHTFASWLVMGGVDIRTVQELLGHKDLRMTMRYAHLAPDHMRKAVEVLDAPAEQTGLKSTEILDGHYLDTEGPNKEKQDVAGQA